ncbi:unnamed protein product [Trichobilharzia regenti]|nr:unnamed protein product [Trichobilharzia regenti]
MEDVKGKITTKEEKQKIQWADHFEELLNQPSQASHPETLRAAFKLTDRNRPPELVRVFLPGRRISSDLKRTQILHPQHGVKISAIVEFTDRPSVLEAINLARSNWGQIYAHLLSTLRVPIVVFTFAVFLSPLINNCGV